MLPGQSETESVVNTGGASSRWKVFHNEAVEAKQVNWWSRGEIVAGIEAASPGMDTVHIAPRPGTLSIIEADYPTRHGMIRMDLNFGGDGRASGELSLPEGMSGIFEWGGREQSLKSGLNRL